MIGSFFDTFFGCPHRRLTRPLTPVSKPGVPSGETYVVCLDCGKQFSYDWDHMRIGKPMDRSHDSGVLHPDTPPKRKPKVGYAILGSAIPLAIVFGSALASKRRRKPAPAQPAPAPEPDASLDQFVALPHGGPGARFRVRDLISYIVQSGRDSIVVGDVDCAFADHPKPRSLDYWLREHFARNKEAKQATPEVVAQLAAAGLFERVPDLPDPDGGERSEGLRLRARQTVRPPDDKGAKQDGRT